MLTSPVVAEPLWIFGSPNWAPIAFGVSNGQGDYFQSLGIPAVVGLQYKPVWLTGVFLGGLPFRSTAPLGGMIL